MLNRILLPCLGLCVAASFASTGYADQRVLSSCADVTSMPRFSPAGRYSSFLSERPADSPMQIWALDLRAEGAP